MDDALSEQYRRRFAATRDYRDAVWRLLVERCFQRWVGPAERVLDLGCGWGEFSRHIRAGSRFAMDLNPDAAALLDPGVHFLRQDCAAPWPLAAASLDVVFSSNFLEHLPDKAAVAATLGEACRCLAPGGRIVLVGPNLRHTGGAYWDFWDHHVPLTERSLAELLTLCGFRIEQALPRFLPYTMSQGRNPPLALVALYLRLPWLWPLLGKQFLVVGRVDAAPGEAPA